MSISNVERKYKQFMFSQQTQCQSSQDFQHLEISDIPNLYNNMKNFR